MRTWRRRFGVRAHWVCQCIASVNRNPAHPIVSCTRHETSWERIFDARARDRGEAEVDRAEGGGRADGHGDTDPSTHDARSFQVRVRGNSSASHSTRRSSSPIATTRRRLLEGADPIARPWRPRARSVFVELSTSSGIPARDCAFSTGKPRFPRALHKVFHSALRTSPPVGTRAIRTGCRRRGTGSGRGRAVPTTLRWCGVRSSTDASRRG